MYVRLAFAVAAHRSTWLFGYAQDMLAATPGTGDSAGGREPALSEAKGADGRGRDLFRSQCGKSP